MVSWVVLYQGFEAYGSRTIKANEGGFSKTVVLTTVVTAPSLKIFTVQEFLDYFNLKIYEDDAENGVKPQQVIKIGTMVESAIQEEAHYTFDNNSGSYYSQTDLIDTNSRITAYYATKIPVRSVTSVHTTQNDQSLTPDYDNNTTEWNSLTEGTDFVIDKGDRGNGRIQITNESYQPISRRWGLRIVYTYGRSSIPSDVKMLAIIETGLRMLDSAMIKSKVGGFFSGDQIDLASFERYKKKVLSKYHADGVSNWNDLPDLA